MKSTSQVNQDEPVGIVISGGHAPEAAPRLFAYIWAPGPDDEILKKVQAA
jgi:GMP synthase-like glutamine amidotransferase